MYINSLRLSSDDFIRKLNLALKLTVYQAYEDCSNNIRIGIVVVVLWAGCVCNQSWHVRTCLSNS